MGCSASEGRGGDRRQLDGFILRGGEDRGQLGVRSKECPRVVDGQGGRVLLLRDCHEGVRVGGDEGGNDRHVVGGAG